MRKLITLKKILYSIAFLLFCFKGISQTTIVASGDTWKYYYNAAAPANDGSGNTWKMSAFNDTGWASGASKLGNDNTPTTTVGNNPVQYTTYFRHTFTVADASIYSDIDLRAIRDDGIVVYLNGTEIWRDNMPAGAIVHGTLANSPAVGGGDETTWFESLGIANLLVTGSNTLAIEVHQQSATSSDISFDFELIANPATLSNFGPGGTWRYLDDGTDQGTAWYGTGFVDTAWASGNAELGFGDGDEATVVTDVNQMTTYFRKSFDVTASEAAKANMIFDLTYDDGAVIYLNGVEVWRVNMPGGAINYLTASSSDSGDNATASTTLANALVTGTNIVAVEIHQRTATSSDISFNLDLRVAENYIINSGDTWSYLDDGSNQGTAWYGVLFNYAAWPTGATEIGYGDGGEATVLTTPPNPKPPTVYFRRNFTITAADIASLKNTLVLNAIRDDGMVVYINGVEVWRDHITGPVNYLTYADTPAIGGVDETTWITTSIPNPFTVPGTYEIGVEIHQVNATSSDLSFDFEMYAENQLLPRDGVWSYLDDGSDQGTAWQTADVSPTGANWATGNAELGFGDGDETTVVADNNQITTYFRKTINAIGTDVTNSTLQISAVRDDGIVIYINGTEVLRNNMPVGTVNYNTLAVGDVTRPTNNFEDFWNVFKIANPLVAGVNEIAVEIHQFDATSDDISFNLELETNNDVIYVPTVKPDRDNDGREDYVDADDDNDGIADLVEGCNTTLPASLETDGDGETDIKPSLPITTVLNDGNSITYSVNNTANFTQLTAYDAGEHGHGIRMRGAVNNGQLTLDFANPVRNLFFKLVDFDGHENIKVDVYDEFGVIVDLTTQEGLYHLGSYIEYLGSNTISEIYNGAAPNINNPENRAHDIYGGAYFYFPSINVSKVTFTANWASGNTIRLVGVQYCSKDTDGDGVDDFYDSDSDNDGIPDLVEVGGTDIDGDGIVDSFIDADYDGITSIYDTDDSSYFIEELGTLTNLDFDGDGIRNNVDLDADNDGILDILEAGGTDVNGDGQIDGFTDANNDGYHDAFDGAGSILITGADTDADGEPNSYANAADNPDSTGLPNFLDVDSDDDGITDHTEAQATAATYVTFSGVDTDGDGILDVNDNFVGFAGNGFTPVDSDSDGTPDYIDTDSDNNGELDATEGHDSNGDGTVNSSDWGTCLNSITSNLGTLSSVDSDGDGLDDGFDNDLVTYDPSNGGMQPIDHPNIDDIATTERDWREPDQEYNIIDFDGVNDYIDFADSHNLTASFTIEAWVKQDATSTGNGMIVSKRDCNKGTNLGYSFGLVNHYPNIKWYDNSGNLVFDLTSSHDIGTDRWYSLSITYDMASTTAKIFIDGIEVASNSAVSAPPSATNESLLLGAKFDDTDLSQKLSNEFKGWIDEVRIWNVALTPTQLRTMMNQEIQQNGTAVQGKTLLIDIPGLNWTTDLLGYYPMNTIVSGDLIDESSNSRDGRIRNILTSQPQTAPLPYTTKANGSWNDVSGTTPWTYGDSVWDAPNSVGIDGSTIIDWNIVQTSHDVTIDTYSGLGREREVLGLIVASNELQVNGNTASGTGNGLTVSQYLKIDGTLDLEGESQLIQPDGSIIDVTSSGTLERDQQGTADLYTYNYWAAPVGVSNTTSNNNSYTLPDVLKGGTNPATPTNISWITSGYDGTASPVGIADYWIWKYANQVSDNYSSWQHVRSTNSLQAGEGYTMKGTTNTGGAITTEQNYVFNGKPHNGDITLTLSGGNDYLIGNPYASAIDANEFILDNISDGAGRAASNIIDGTLYFWEHFASSTHLLAEYEGGYGSYTLMGGVIAINNDVRINNTGASGTKMPERYIPVGQGFFVTAGTGGNVTFKNSQRTFRTEASDPSTFMRAAGNKKGKVNTTNSNNDNIDTRQKIRLMFDSPKGYHRQLLVGVDPNATDNHDIGYDAPLIEDNVEDMYWAFDSNKFVIQGVGDFNDDRSLPLGVKIDQEGNGIIRIDEIENISSNTIIYLHDKDLEIYHDLTESDYEVYLTTGEYLERFEIVFGSKEEEEEEEIIIVENTPTNFDVHYSNNIKSIIIINPNAEGIKSVEMLNILGQTIYINTNVPNDSYTEYKIDNLHTGTYIINIQTSKEIITKKVIVE
jgi:hypothetical protein